MTHETPLGTVLTQLYATIETRRSSDAKQSYTAALLKGGPEKCAKKFGEEAVEAVIAGTLGQRDALIAEAADALYHLMVLMAANEVTPAEVARELQGRTAQSGHAEKASRS